MSSTSKPHENPKKLSPGSDFISGSVAGIAARMCVAPLDMLKIRFQVQSAASSHYQYSSITSAVRRIVATEGITALWKGNSSAIMMVIPYAGIQMACFYQLRQSRLPHIGEPYSSLALGAVSSSTATIVTYPLDLLRTRFAAQPEPKMYHGLRHAVTAIVSSRGLVGLYDGLRPTLLQIVPYISLHFSIYENLKASVIERRANTDFSSVDSLMVGAISGTTSKAATLPLDNAKKLMQVETQFSQNSTPTRSILTVLRTMWRSGGVAACFRGLTPSLLKAAPSSAITFAVYERMKLQFSAV